MALHDTERAQMARKSPILVPGSAVAEGSDGAPFQPEAEEVPTPHGAAALASSETGDMTVAEVMAAIDAGRLREPFNHYLCKDGYYARRLDRERA